MSEKRRMSISVPEDVVEAARAAVDAGEADNVSAWATAAMRERAERDQKLRLMGAWIRDFEAEYGEITEDEMEAADQAMRRRSIVVRGGVVFRPSA